MDAIRVFVVDDHPIIRHGLAAMLAADRGVRWVGDAADGAEALRTAPPLRPDVLLIELNLPQMDGIAVLCALRPLLPRARFVVLASRLDPADMRRGTAAGAAGFLLKSASVADVAGVVRTAHRGERLPAPVPPSPPVGGVASVPATAPPAGSRQPLPGADLTLRERELLGLMAQGLSNQDISTQLAIAMPTVKFHVTNILAKLHADNRTEAVLVALRQKIVKLLD